MCQFAGNLLQIWMKSCTFWYVIWSVINWPIQFSVEFGVTIYAIYIYKAKRVGSVVSWLCVI